MSMVDAKRVIDHSQTGTSANGGGPNGKQSHALTLSQKYIEVLLEEFDYGSKILIFKYLQLNVQTHCQIFTGNNTK